MKIDELIRRLVLLGVPLVPTVGCTQTEHSCSGAGGVDNTYVELTRPTEQADAGAEKISLGAWNRCVEKSECLPLCEEHFMWRADVQSCEAVAPDAGAGASDRIGIKAKVIFVCVGRRPEQHTSPPSAGSSDELGAWLVEAAWLEHASVEAFVRLACELEAHGAPAEFIERANEFAEDERRHARMMGDLAILRGACLPQPLAAVDRPVRSLFDVAAENAIEGCVRETMGALVAAWQATHATDVGIRAAMQVIAKDEARHAELALDIHQWLSTVLDPPSWQGVQEALAAEKEALLRHEMPDPVDVGLLSTGLPGPGHMRQMIRLTDRLLWSSAA